MVGGGSDVPAAKPEWADASSLLSSGVMAAMVARGCWRGKGGEGMEEGWGVAL